MKQVFFVLIFMLSLSAEAYYFGSSGIDRDLDSIKRKQECLERQNREQREYSECLERCRQQEALDRQMASITGSSGSFVSSCYCSQPISIGCY